MIILYSMIFLMALIAILIIAVPLLKYAKKCFLIVTSFILIFSLSIYFLTSHQASLKEWVLRGKNHYDLLIEYQKLGGLDGLIQKVQTKLKTNPEDAEGWFILGKLYLMKNDTLHAKKSFEKAHRLKPSDGQIEYFYKKTSSS